MEEVKNITGTLFLLKNLSGNWSYEKFKKIFCRQCPEKEHRKNVRTSLLYWKPASEIV